LLYASRCYQDLQSFPTRRSSDLLNFIVAIIPVKSGRHVCTVSMASNAISLSSCISLLYASGIPFIVVRSDISAPYTRPVFPLTRSEEHTSELQSRFVFVCRLLLE